MSTTDPNTRSPFSIVIASWSGEVALQHCLESLLPQSQGSEVIVASSTLSPAISTDNRFRNVRFVQAPADATVFQLRSLGLHQARGNSIALIEDHSAVSPDWFKTLADGQAAGLTICGGPIENDSQSSAYDWALYFAEYVRFMPPVCNGETTILSGANVVYDRATLWSCSLIWQSAFYETDVNAALLNAGHKLYMLPAAVVTSRLRMPLGEAMKHLFHGGNHFGNFRKSRAQPLARCWWIVVSPAIPIVMLFRIVRITAARRPQRLVQLFFSLPYLVLLVGAWSLGEANGYLRPAKQSHVKSAG